MSRVTIRIEEVNGGLEATVLDDGDEQFAKVYCSDAWLIVESCATYVAALLEPDPLKTAFAELRNDA